MDEPAVSAKDGVKAEVFVEEMSRLWTDDFSNHLNPTLKENWEILCHAFNAYLTGIHKGWSHIPLPTGAGKTQGLTLYSAMLSHLPNSLHSGILIVTRLKTDCDLISNNINKWGVRPTAVSYHSDVEMERDELSKFPVVVITHKAYQNALKVVRTEDKFETCFHEFLDWNGGLRALTVIDEYLDCVEHHRVTDQRVSTICSNIPESLATKYEEEFLFLSELSYKFNQFKVKRKTMTVLESLQLAFEVDSVPYLESLVEEYELYTKRVCSRKRTTPAAKAYLRQTLKTLKAVSAMVNTWVFYAKEGRLSTLNTANLLIPIQLLKKGAVILDATAEQNEVMRKLFPECMEIPVLKGSRSYTNFKLNVAYGYRVGKEFLAVNAGKVAKEVMKALRPYLGKPTFIVCHKDEVEPELIRLASRDCREVPFDQPENDRKLNWVDVNHHGNVLGSNRWKDYQQIAIVGLPYLPPSWSAGNIGALKGALEKDDLKGSLQRELVRGQLSVDIIQTLNRIAVRRTIDEQGNCPITEGFLWLPNDADGRHIVGQIRLAMPDIQVNEEWKPKTPVMEQTGKPNEVKIAIALKAAKVGHLFGAKSLQEASGVGANAVKGFFKDINLTNRAPAGWVIDKKQLDNSCKPTTFIKKVA